MSLTLGLRTRQFAHIVNSLDTEIPHALERQGVLRGFILLAVDSVLFGVDQHDDAWLTVVTVVIA